MTAPSDVALDVRDLPTYGFGTASLMWWSTMGLMVIEGTVFAIGVMMYLYIRGVAVVWPIEAPPPELLWGTLNTLVLLASLWPNEMARRAALSEDRARARAWLLACVAFSLIFLAIRALEFTTLNVGWQDNAYGSIVWLLLGLHTTHLITDTIDTTVLAVLLFTGPFENKRHVDVCENALYWYFVVASWLPIFAVVYLAGRR